MTISNKDLFMAILSMDSYNRGYGAGITGLGDKPIGNATFSTDSTLKLSLEATSAAGFYAAAYTTDYGTVISYRGTNFSSGAAYADIVNGWAFAVGDFTADQLELSTAFLEQVVRANGPAVTLTGHSLGGGLAGFNSTLYGQQAVVFDTEPYRKAAFDLLDYYIRELSILDIGTAAQPIQLFEQIRQGLIDGLFFISDAIAEARRIYSEFLSPFSTEQLESGTIGFYNNTTGYYLPGEALSFELGGFNIRSGENYPGIVGVGFATEAQNLAELGPVDLHSAGALVIQMFSDKYGHSDNWLPIHAQVYRALFSENIASALKPLIDNDLYLDGYGYGYMLQQIAYSALDGSEGLVFGNSGIRALFDDAVQLGDLKTAATWSSLNNEMIGGITKAFVQYAGTLAINKVDYSLALNSGSPIDPRSGIVFFVNNGLRTNAVTGADSLLLDFSEARWTVGAANTANQNIIGINDIVELVISGSINYDRGSANNPFNSAFISLYGQTAAYVIERIEFSFTQGGQTYTLGGIPVTVHLINQSKDVKAFKYYAYGAI